MEKFKNITFKAVLFLLIIIVTYVTYCSIFNIYRPQEELQPLIIILGSGVLICLFLTIDKIIKKIPENKINILAIVLSILFLVGLIFIGSNLTSIPHYDLSHLQKQAIIMLENGGKISSGYFQIYPSQVPASIFVFFIYKIGTLLNFENLRLFGTIFNALLMAITAYFTYLSVKEISNKKKALTTLVFFVINPIFYFYVSYFYTDTLCLPFCAIAIYLFIKGIKNNNNKLKIISLLASGILIAIGYKIRVVVVIILIAIIMESFLNNKVGKKILKNISSIIIGFLIGIMLCKLIEMPFGFEKNKDKEIPITHWIMMGLNQPLDGQFNSNDYAFTRNKSTYSKKVTATINESKKRLKSLGIANIFQFLGKKLQVNWSNGEYMYTKILQNVEGINSLYNYTVGNQKIFALYYVQICKTSVFVLFLIVVIREIKKKTTEKGLNQIMIISVFGAFLFYLIWEVKARYSFTFLPWFILLVPEGLSTIKKIKIPWKKVISICTIIISLGIFIVNFNKFTTDKNIYCDKRVTQERTDEMYKISDKIIKQNFYTDKKFNCIKLVLYKSKKPDITNYVFELLDSNENKICVKEFTSEMILDSQYNTFSFETVKPKENEKYTIKIYSKDAIKANSISIACFFDGKLDMYPDGKLIINDKEKVGDMLFSVQEEIERPYVSKKIYILIATMVLGIEIFAFYPYLISQNKKDKISNNNIKDC